MKLYTLICTIVLTIVLVIQVYSNPGNAAVINGGFETGNFTGWKTIGNARVVDSKIGSGPTEGKYQALLTTAAGSVSVSALESFLGVPPGTANSLTKETIVSASAIKQTFKARAGDVFYLDYNFLTNELTRPRGFFNDFFFGIGFVSKGIVVSAQRENISDDLLRRGAFRSSTPFHDESRFRKAPETAPFIVPATGTYTIALGVVNAKDKKFDSGVLLDNITLTQSHSR
jgi:hypothetical protein